MKDAKVLKSVELEDGRIIRYKEGMGNIEEIIKGLEKDVVRFETEIANPNCSFDRKAIFEHELNTHLTAIEGWKQML